MRSTLAFTVLFFVSNAFAFGVPSMPNMDFPTESGWAKGMTSMACKVKFAKSDVGTIEKAQKGVVYTVYSKSGQIKASAWASSDYIGAKKKCMMK